MRDRTQKGASTRVPTAAGDSETEGLAELARRVVAGLSARPERRLELLGEAFLACEELRRTCPSGFAEAADRGTLVEWCLPRVRARLAAGDPHAEASSRIRGGWLGTFVGPDARDVADDHEFAGRDPEAARLAERALARALSRARQQGNATLLRNLGWYRQRLEHKTYGAIARAEGRVPATIRTGVARARKFVLRIVHELQHAQPAPLSADAPPEIEPLRQLWLDQELDALERELERTRPEFGDDPHWLNLSALLAADRGRRGEARRLYEAGLVRADAAFVRARLLNNLANLADDEGDIEEARLCWQRAHQLAPHTTTPLLNLLAAASLRKDYASAQHFAALLGELLSSGRLSEQERSYASRRLRENPKLDWLRDTELWRLGPARWIRASAAEGGSTRAGRLRRFTGIVVAVVLALVASAAGGGEARAAHAALASQRLQLADPADGLLWPEAARGGDSMGSPAGRGGDSGRG